jgi:hypothetical protein
LPRIVSIVEGHGEVEAVPILVRRIVAEAAKGQYVDIAPPIRIKRQKFLKEGELERAIELAARQTTPHDGILILLDADDDCPGQLAQRILARAAVARPDRRVRVVFPKRMYEAWFLAAAASLAGQRRLDAAAVAPLDPEANPNPKAWLSERMPSGSSYRETLDQPAFTALFDLNAACAAPSFRKLCRDIASLL